MRLVGKEIHRSLFRVPADLRILGGLVSRHASLFIRLGNLESRYLAHVLDQTGIESPVYICGLARSGTTILLEILSRIKGVATHRYRDFPPVFIPYFWNRLLDMTPRKKAPPVERTHLDGIFVTQESPEAVEEPIWMAFFTRLHDPTMNNTLDERTSEPRFERFYTEHIRKLLHVRNGKRYVSKGNYNVSRLGYLHKLFPNARFVISIRRPVDHIASLAKQHMIFCRGEKENPAMLEHMRQIGHFEFGLDRRPINTGNSSASETLALWEREEEPRGWAKYWNSVYRYVFNAIESSDSLQRACLIVRYEDLCRDPGRVIRDVFNHCGFSDENEIIMEYSRKIKAPDYYQHNFSGEDIEVISAETSEAARRAGYEL